MMPLGLYRNATPLLADVLPWAALVAEGVVLNKDGALQRSARFRGPDLDSATPAELVAVTHRLNNALRRLGSGWAIFVEAQRLPAAHYPQGVFPDPASALVDLERREQFAEEGAHFESRYFLTVLWLPPAQDAARAEGWLYEGRQARGVDAWEQVRGFIDRTDRILQLVEGFVPEIAWLDDGETLTYLHSTVSTRRHRVRVPETPMHLDVLLADEPLTGGLEPRLGEQHLRTLTVIGFPSATFPGLLDDLNRLAFAYRWSTRAPRRVCGELSPRASGLGLAIRNSLATFFLFEQRRVVGVGGEPNFISLDVGDQAGRDIVVVVAVGPAVRARQLDPVTLDLVDRAEVDAVGADDFHVFLDRR